MVSIASVTNVPPVVNATLPTQPIAVADRVSTRITPVAVSAPIANERVNDDNVQRDVKQATLRAAPDQASFQQGTSRAATVKGDSSAFLTQVFSQASNATLTTAQNFSRFAPALQYNTLVSYSFVKYKPSNAGVPTSGRASAPPAEVASEYQAYNEAQSRTSSLQSPATSPIVISG